MLLHPIDSALAGPAGWFLSWWFVVLAVLLGTSQLPAQQPEPAPQQALSAEELQTLLARLLERLEAKSESTREKAARNLGALGPKARPAIPRLLARLTDASSNVGRQAQRALNQIDPDWPTTAAASKAFFLLLVQLHFQPLDDGALLIRQVSVPPVKWVVANGTTSVVEREALLAFLDRLQQPTPAPPQGIEAITRFGPRAVPYLIRQLASSDPGIELETENALDRIAPDWTQSTAARLTIPLFRAQPAPGDQTIQKARARVLARIGPAGPETVPERIQRQVDLIRLADEFPHVQLEAARTLVKIGPAARGAVAGEAVPALARLLDRPYHADLALELLETIGPDAKLALPRLLAVLELPGVGGGTYIGKVLGKIGPAAVPEVLKMTHAREWTVRYNALQALAAMGPAANSALGDLVLLRGDGDFAVRAQAEKALEKIRSILGQEPRCPKGRTRSDQAVEWSISGPARSGRGSGGNQFPGSGSHPGTGQVPGVQL